MNRAPEAPTLQQAFEAAKRGERCLQRNPSTLTSSAATTAYTAQTSARPILAKDTNRINPARVSGPRDRPRRAASATSPDRVFQQLSWGANTSHLREGRADDTTRSDVDGRARGRVPGSWRIASSLRTTGSLTGTVDGRLDVAFVDVSTRSGRAWASRVASRRSCRHGIRSGGNRRRRATVLAMGGIALCADM